MALMRARARARVLLFLHAINSKLSSQTFFIQIYSIIAHAKFGNELAFVTPFYVYTTHTHIPSHAVSYEFWHFVEFFSLEWGERLIKIDNIFLHILFPPAHKRR